MSVPLLSVIVPAHRAAKLLPDTLGAIAASDLPRSEWELIVVDDASNDDTAAVAEQFADRVVRIPGRAGGPGRARNAGAKVANGTWLVFVDADVRVHTDTLRRIAAVTHEGRGLVAVFGSYDDRPAARGLLTEYRNLLHRQVHCAGAGDAETFWAGCGAVRRDAFDTAGGFDVARFGRPSIEDIELGYRLRDGGGRIRLDPSIQGTHLKRWTLRMMVTTDIRDRGIPWMRLLLERGNRRSAALNTGRTEQIKVALAATAIVAGAGAVAFRDMHPAWVALALLAILVVSNAKTFAWFARERGPLFALMVLPLNLLYYIGNVISAVVGVAQHLLAGAQSHEAMRPAATRGAGSGGSGR